MANYEVLEPGGHAALVDGLKDYADREGGTDTEQLADGSVEMDKFGDDVLDELDSKAYADGYYAQMTVGAADNLTGRGDTATASFLYRTAGGTADIETGQAVAKSVKGNTIRWNQMRQPSDGSSSGTSQGITYTKNNDGSVAIGGTATDNYYTRPMVLSTGTPVSGHKYLLKGCCPVGGSATTYYAGFGGSVMDTGSGYIWACSSSSGTELRIVVKNGVTIPQTTLWPQLFDLTTMFGVGNEPETVAEFEALYPKPYYAYDAGSLLPVNMTGIETTGFNQWDEEWEAGGISTSGVNANDQNRVRSKNYVPVIDGAEYYLTSPSVNNGYNATVHCYDADFNHFEDIVPWTRNSTATFPSGTKYIRFTFGNSSNPVTSLSAGTVCINLSWSGRRNGEYEPYWTSQREIAASTYFPDGMRSAGSIYDELTSTEAITRVGVVDLGTLNWYNDSGYTVWYTTKDQLPAKPMYIGGLTCSKYQWKQGQVSPSTLPDGCIAVTNSAEVPILRLNDSSFAGYTADQVKAALSGVMLHYELAEPTVTPIDPALNLSYRVDDFGTERIMVPTGEQSAPPTLEVAYGLNAVDFIRRAPTQYISHDSHENFVDALEAEMGVTVTETFDDTDNAYEYSIVPTDGMTIKQAKENLRGLLDLVQGTIGSVTDWSEIAEMASHGSSFLVGTQFQTTYKSAADGTEYEMPWDVMHFETATVKGGSSVAGVYLESHYALPFATMFDQIEAFYAVPSGGLAAGTYSITFGNTSAWGQVPANSTYSFTLANSYSQGAQLCFNRSIYSYAPDTCSVQAFATQGATTASETVTVSAGSAGTSLGTIGTEQVTDSSDLNHLHHIGLGSNRWMTSALRQWLNTDADGGTWWVPQTKWDRPPSYASYDGFLKGLDHDLVSAMREVRVVTAQSYSADGGTAAAPVTDVTYDKVFLPSWEQQYLVISQSYGGTAGLEGSAWDYWKLAAGTANPRPASISGNESTYTTAYVRYGMENHATARGSWLRSANRYYGGSAASVSSSGYCGSGGANNGSFAAPACFIG